MPRALTSTELEEDARLLYHQDRFAEALETINRSIRLTVQPSPTQLDLLAASQEKIEDYDGALANAKVLIRSYSLNPIGYFRAAHVLQKLEKTEAARKIIERGLKTVPKDHALYRKLHQKASQMSGNDSGPTGTDPLRILPLEMVEMILMNLSFRQRIPCLRVCKAWQKLMHSMPQLWLHLDLSQAVRWVSPKFVDRCFNASRHRIEKAFVRRVKKPEPVVEALTKRCNYLTDLAITYSSGESLTCLSTLSAATNLRHLSLTAEIIFTEVVQGILLSCHQLESLECSGIIGTRVPSHFRDLPQSLREFRLVASKHFSLAGIHNLESLIACAHGLQKFALLGFDTFGLTPISLDLRDYVRLQHLHVDDISCVPMHLPATLEFLSLNSAVWPALMTSLDEIRPLSGFPQLRQLSCRGIWAACQLLQSEDTTKTGLSWLDIAGSDREHLDTLFALDRLKSLTVLTLRSYSGEVWSGMDEEVVPRIIRLTELETVDVSLSDISGYGVKQLALNLPRLKLLKLEYCRNLSSDAVEWVRARGIAVTHKSIDTAPYGRKVRYGQ